MENSSMWIEQSFIIGANQGGGGPNNSGEYSLTIGAYLFFIFSLGGPSNKNGRLR